MLGTFFSLLTINPWISIVPTQVSCLLSILPRFIVCLFHDSKISFDDELKKHSLWYVWLSSRKVAKLSDDACTITFQEIIMLLVIKTQVRTTRWKNCHSCWPPKGSFFPTNDNSTTGLWKVHNGDQSAFRFTVIAAIFK